MNSRPHGCRDGCRKGIDSSGEIIIGHPLGKLHEGSVEDRASSIKEIQYLYV